MSDAAALDQAAVEYPSSDGRPLAETPLHVRRLTDSAHAVNMFLRTRPDAYVGVDMMVYDEPGNPRRHLAPDLFVAFGAEDRDRDVYKLWEDPVPAFVLEVTSKTTRREDERKKIRYARWGVAEYFQYDPRAEYLDPPLQGKALARAGYRAMQECVLPNGERGFFSAEPGLYLWLDDSVLRFYDAATRRTLLTPEEVENARTAAAARAAKAEAELAELRAGIQADQPAKGRLG